MSDCLEKLRKRIDRIDEGVVELLSERMECAAEISRFKNKVRDESRELEVLERIQRISRGRIDSKHVDAVYRRIIKASVDLQTKLVSSEKVEVTADQAGTFFAGERIVILGAGKMGSWLALELSKVCPVGIYDVVQERAKSTQPVEALEELEDVKCFCPSILVNAVSLEKTREAFETVLPFISSDCVLVDIMSIKGTIQEFYSMVEQPFVSIHPMFGPRFTDMADLTLENAIIVSESHPPTSLLFKEFFEKLGITVHTLPMDSHDREMANSLTLPFAASIVFSASAEPGGIPGTTFTRHNLMARRLFMEDNYLLAEVMFNPDSKPALEKICSSLEYMKHIALAKDYNLAEEFISELRKKVGETNDRA